MNAYTQGVRIAFTQLAFTSLTAALLMAFTTTSATATNISISHGELFTAEWQQLQFRIGEIVAVECNVTLEGSSHYRTILKARDSLVGYITRAIANTCRTGSATVLTTNLPWHIRYQGFEGTLPNITGVRIALILAEFRIHESPLGTECLARTTAMRPAEGVVRLGAGSERRLVTALTADTNRTMMCGIFEGPFAGTAGVREVPGRAENLLLRLIEIALSGSWAVRVDSLRPA